MRVAAIVSGSITDIAVSGRVIPILQNLSKLGNTITLYSPECYDAEVKLALRTYGKPLYRNVDNYSRTIYYSTARIIFNSIYSSIDLFLKLVKSNDDLIYVFKAKPNNAIVPILLKTFLRKKILVDIDDNENEYTKSVKFNQVNIEGSSLGAVIIRILNSICISNSNGITVVSKILFRHLPKKYSHKICYLPNSISINDIGSGSAHEIQKNRIVFPAGLKKRKCLIAYFLPEIITHVMPMVIKEVKTAKLVIVGEGDFKEELEKMAKLANVDKSVLFLGWKNRKSLLSIIKNSEVGILPLKDNNITNIAETPLKLVEYLACGVGIVATDVGDVKKVLSNCGMVIRGEDYQEFAKSIITLLKNDKLRTGMAKRAKEKAINDYTWEKNVAKLNEFIKII